MLRHPKPSVQQSTTADLNEAMVPLLYLTVADGIISGDDMEPI